MDGGMEVILSDLIILSTHDISIYSKKSTWVLLLCLLLFIFLSPISGRVPDTISTTLLCHEVKAAQIVGWGSALQLSVV